MDNFETPYEEENEFIECGICNKSIRGETLYKIHLTTPGHLKKEDALVAEGLAVYQQPLPVFEGILHYLDYMKINEPIIGLDFLEEVPSNDPQGYPRYTCKLCQLTANLPETVHHVIGRKHRQKYVELKRPDLVTWDKQSILTQGGKIIRARAEIIERQDGRGKPQQRLKKSMEGKYNTSRVPPRQTQIRDRNVPLSLTQHDMPSHLKQLMGYQDEFSHQGRYPPENSNAPPVHAADPFIGNINRLMSQRGDTFSHNRIEEELLRGDYRESDIYRREVVDPDYRRDYTEKYVEDQPRRALLGPDGAPMFNSREEIPYGQAQNVEYFPEEAPPIRRPNQERDHLKEFYTEEVRRKQLRAAEYMPSQPANPADHNQRWSLERESGRQEGVNRAGRQGSGEPEAKKRSFPTPMEREREQSRDHLINTIRDYWNEMGEQHQEGEVSNPGTSRTGPPISQRQGEATRAISDIPEPFRRFLTGAAKDEEHSKRRRKSRFTDATAEEVETTKEMYTEEYVTQNQEFGGHPRPVGAPLKPEIHGPQHPDHYIQLQNPHHTESYKRGGSETEDVFDILKNIEIENAEEADFLKNKLCHLLKEFKNKKSEKSGQNSHGRAVISTDYNSSHTELSIRQQYDSKLQHRQDSDLRRAQGHYFEDKQLQEYHHPAQVEPRQSSRSRYEEAFGLQKMSRPQHAIHPDEPVRYPERFQEPIHPRDYRSTAEGFLDSHSSTPPLHMQRGPRMMDMGPQYSNKLDKITSTLLELVSRK